MTARIPSHRVPFFGGVGPDAALAWADWHRVDPLPPLRLASGRGIPRQPTVVRIARTGAVWRFRFEAADTEPWSTMTRRDDPLWQEEVVEVFLAPGAADPSRYFEFEVNPAGALFDAEISNPDGRRETMTANTAWDCDGIAWAAGIDGRAGGWWAEIAIPVEPLLSGEPEPESWRCNVFRIDRPRGEAPEFACWSPTLTDPADFHKPERFGRLELLPRARERLEAACDER